MAWHDNIDMQAIKNMVLTKFSPILAASEFLSEIFDINTSNYKFGNISFFFTIYIKLKFFWGFFVNKLLVYVYEFFICTIVALCQYGYVCPKC